jgi:hypothetical protein
MCLPQAQAWRGIGKDATIEMAGSICRKPRWEKGALSECRRKTCASKRKASVQVRERRQQRRKITHGAEQDADAAAIKSMLRWQARAAKLNFSVQREMPHKRVHACRE